jgi:nucleotide-binding universal stress UspA family protein
VNTILVGTDFSQGAKQTVEVAAQLAAATGAELHVLHAMANPMVVTSSFMAADMPSTGSVEEVTAASAEQLAATVSDLRERGFEVTVETHQLIGGAGDALCQLAGEIGADVIVVGNRRMQGKGRVLGSVAGRVAHHAPCHVFIAHTS